MAYDDSEKRRADRLHALWVGTAIGTAEGVAQLKADFKKAEKDLLTSYDIIKKNRNELLGNIISKIADVDAQKSLLKEIIMELKNPELERRFSEPDADFERGQFLQNVHRQSWSKNMGEQRADFKNDNEELPPEIFYRAQELSINKMREYKKESENAQKETMEKRKRKAKNSQ